MAKARSPWDAINRRLDLAIAGKRGRIRAEQYNGGSPLRLDRVSAGKLSLPTGRIVVTDAYCATEYPPLSILVAPGRYPIDIVLAKFARRIDSARGAFLVVTFSSDKVVLWLPVTAVAAADPCFTDESPNSFVQEGATGVFSAESAAIHFAGMKDPVKHARRLGKHEHREGNCDWLNYRPARGPENAILCRGGYGDGTYQCYAGHGPNARVARLVIDFNVAQPTPDR